MKISAIVLTKNEEKNIERCLKALEFCSEIIVIDDFSTDKTLQKIKALDLKSNDVKVYKKKLDNDFAEQRNFGMAKARNEWVLFADADEVVTENLKKEILVQIQDSETSVAAFYIRRRDYFWGNEIKFGETGKVRTIGLIRLVGKNSGKWMGKVHEEFKLNNPTQDTKHLTNYINHYPHQTIKDFLEQVNFYSTLRAKELLGNKRGTNILEIIVFPFGKFIYTYILKLGFLDGPGGFVYSFFMSFHSFLVRAKLYQYINIDKAK